MARRNWGPAPITDSVKPSAKDDIGVQSNSEILRDVRVEIGHSLGAYISDCGTS